MARKQRILAVEHERPDAARDDVDVELDGAVVEEAREPVPMVERVADVLGDGGFCPRRARAAARTRP